MSVTKIKNINATSKQIQVKKKSENANFSQPKADQNQKLKRTFNNPKIKTVPKREMYGIDNWPYLYHIYHFSEPAMLCKIKKTR
jgi:hypothetical protein